jgi:YVTN family beta-propeller protein
MVTRSVLCALSLCAIGPAAAAAVPLGGTLVVLNKAEATASLVDVATGTVVATLPTGAGPHEVAVSPDGRLALATNYGTREKPGSTLTLIDVPAARVVRTITLPAAAAPHGVRFLDARRALVTAEGLKSLLVVDPDTGTLKAAIPTQREVSHMVATTPDGRRAFVASIGSGSVTAIDLATGTVLAQLSTGKGAEGIAVSPDGREAWVANRAADTVSVIDTVELKVVAEIPSAGFPIRVAFTPNGRRALVSHARSGDVTVYDTAARLEERRLNAHFSPKPGAANLLGFEGAVPVGIVIDPSGSLAWVAHTNADAVAAFEIASGRLVATLSAGREPDGMAYSALAAAPR